MARTRRYCLKLVFLNETEEEAFENAKNIALKPRIPRPPNAFMLYANENRKIMAQQFPADSNKEISKKLGSSWKNLDIIEKNKYFDRARIIDLEHKKKYPIQLQGGPIHPNFIGIGPWASKIHNGAPYSSSCLIRKISLVGVPIT